MLLLNSDPSIVAPTQLDRAEVKLERVLRCIRLRRLPPRRHCTVYDGTRPFLTIIGNLQLFICIMYPISWSIDYGILRIHVADARASAAARSPTDPTVVCFDLERIF